MVHMATVLFLWQIASTVYPLTWSYYAIARFGWSDAMIGASLAGAGIAMTLGQIFITGRAVERFGERGAAIIGLSAAMAGFIAYAAITQSWMAFFALVFVAFQAMAQPSIMAMLSRRGTAETQGEVQGIASMAMGLGAIVAPLLLNPALAYFTGDHAPFHFAGAAFVISAIVTVAAILLLMTTPRVLPA